MTHYAMPLVAACCCVRMQSRIAATILVNVNTRGRKKELCRRFSTTKTRRIGGGGGVIGAATPGMSNSRSTLVAVVMQGEEGQDDGQVFRPDHHLHVRDAVKEKYGKKWNDVGDVPACGCGVGVV